MQPLRISRASAILTQTFFILSVSMEIAATPFCILNFFRIEIEQKRSMSKIISQNWRFAQYDESKQRFKLAAPFLDLLPTSTLRNKIPMVFVRLTDITFMNSEQRSTDANMQGWRTCDAMT